MLGGSPRWNASGKELHRLWRVAPGTCQQMPASAERPTLAEGGVVVPWRRPAISQRDHELVPVPLEEFTARHLQKLAVEVIETPPRFGFSPYRQKVSIESLGPDELRKRKRIFNSLISILRMAFQLAWDSVRRRALSAPAPRGWRRFDGSLGSPEYPTEHLRQADDFRACFEVAVGAVFWHGARLSAALARFRQSL
jgi:hypothetical protein